MILSLTPNPSLDLLFGADRLVWDDANRVPMPRRRPGGQGINLVRAVRALDPGTNTLAVAPLGGGVGRELEAALRSEGTPLRAVPLDGETRLFVGARERETGRSLLLNPRGPDAPAGLADALEAAVLDALDGESQPSVACCGSLLPGLPVDLYARIGHRVREQGGRFVPDCDGDALAAALPVADLLVPNDMEAARLAGRPVDGPGAAAAVGRSLLGRGPRRVVVTLGDRGAVSVTEAGAWWACPVLPAGLARAVGEGSAVGAGDAFLAALLLAGDADRDALVEAVAAGTAVLLGRGATLVDPSDVDRVRPHVRVEALG